MYSIAERLKILWKLGLSYRKASWEFEDYPKWVRPNGAERPVRNWQAQILNWPGPIGLGETPDKALVELRESFGRIRENRIESGESMPRPGVSVPISFASTDKIARDPELLEDFIQKVLGFCPDELLFISDESSLWDFARDDDEIERFRGLIRSNYNVETNDMSSANIAEILQRISRHRRVGG